MELLFLLLILGVFAYASTRWGQCTILDNDKVRDWR